MEGTRVNGLVVRRGLAIGLLGLLAFALIPANAAAASTYTWALSCKGFDYGLGLATWTWTANGVDIGSGGTYCSGDQQSSASGLSRPDGADGLTVHVRAAYDDGAHLSGSDKTATKSFKVDASFNFKTSVTFLENSAYGKIQYTVSLLVTG